MNCECQSKFEVRLARVTDYDAFKKMTDAGRHPAFIGRKHYISNAHNGGCLFYFYGREPCAVSMMNPRLGSLSALNVHPAHRGHGLGGAIVRFLVPNFVRAIESKVEFFRKLGYVPVGKMKEGVTLKTQIMARQALFGVAGNLSLAYPDQRYPVGPNTEQTGDGVHRKE